MALSIMTSRYIHLEQALAGYIQTGVPFVESVNGKIIPTYTTDDIGIYYWIPKLCYYFNLSLDSAILVFFYGILGISLISGIIGFLFLFKNPIARSISTFTPIFSMLFFARYVDLDVYVISEAVAIALVPWALYFFTRKISSLYTYSFMFLSGLIIGYAHYIRSYSSAAELLFISILLLTQVDISWVKKIFFMLVLLCGIAIPKIQFNYAYNNYLIYAHETMSDQLTDHGSHPFWHPVYLGFGFLNNPMQIKYDDSFGLQKAQETSSDVISVSDEYEHILKKEVINLLKNHKLFVLYTLWAKIGILLFFFLLCANIGIPLAYFFPKGWRIDLAFFVALSVSSLFGILVMPLINYLLGFMTLSMLYGIVSINYALEDRSSKLNKGPHE